MSTRKGIIRVVREYGEPIIEDLGYELVDVEFLKEMDNYFLRIYIHKKGGVNLDDCQIVTEKISEILDEHDPVEQAYYLEVSSPGLDRPLKTDRDYERNLGEEVELRFYQAIDNKKQLEGILEGYDDVNFYIVVEEETREIPKESVSLMKLVIKF